VQNSAGTYIIYSLSGSITLKATASATGTVQATAPFTGVLRLVKLNDTAHKTLLDAHASVYPTSVGVDYSFTDTQGTLIFNWNVVGTASNLLMLTWPHHRLKLVSPDSSTWPSTSSLSYLTTKGYMYPILGNQWKMTYDLPSISWNAPRAPHSSCLSNLISGLEYEIAQLNASNPSVPGDFYYWGGAMNAQARLA
jgi:endo-1,3(4)-beta-glucanase